LIARTTRTFTLISKENNCICAETGSFSDPSDAAAHYQGDVDDLVRFGFDSVKLDGWSR